LLTGRVLTIDEVIARIDSVTINNLTHVAQQLFITEKLNLAVVGPAEQDENFAKILKI
jgi:predicted Zn-dependent peptidase